MNLPNTSLSDTGVYTTPSGRALVCQILSRCKPVAIEPHDYQCEGICQALDGDDVITTMATGAGKMGLLSFLMLAVHAISQESGSQSGVAKLHLPQGSLYAHYMPYQDSRRRYGL